MGDTALYIQDGPNTAEVKAGIEGRAIESVSLWGTAATVIPQV